MATTEPLLPANLSDNLSFNRSATDLLEMNSPVYIRRAEAELNLVASLLQDAIDCFQRYTGGRGAAARREFLDAERWLFHSSKDWVFSFENVCHFLQLEPAYIRAGLRRWQRARASAGPTTPQAPQQSPQ